MTKNLASGTVPGYSSPGLGERPLVHGAGEGLDTPLRYCGLPHEAWLPPGVPGKARVALRLKVICEIMVILLADV
jgi:hypothetical protein